MLVLRLRRRAYRAPTSKKPSVSAASINRLCLPISEALDEFNLFRAGRAQQVDKIASIPRERIRKILSRLSS
jgi:hypothetical protein